MGARCQRESGDLPRAALRAVTVGAATLLIAVAWAMPSARGASHDPLVHLQWSLDRIGADPGVGPGGVGVRVAVIDSGIDFGHEDLRGAVVEGVDCLGSGGDAALCRPGGQDDDGHGTHVAGIVAARAGNGKGIAGVAPRATLLAVRALARGCEEPVVGPVLCGATGNSTDVEAGIRWAVANGARVVNLSVSDDTTTRVATGTPLRAAIEEAWSRGVIVVIAAGNDLDTARGSGYGDLPAIVVAATGPDDSKPRYSNSVGEARWGISAPGGTDDGPCPSGAVLSTWLASSPPGEPYACLDGTSMAAPHVSGAAAVLLSAGLPPPQVVTHLLDTARDLGAPGADPIYGAGMLDLRRALATLPSAAGGGVVGSEAGPATVGPAASRSPRPAQPPSRPPGATPVPGETAPPAARGGPPAQGSDATVDGPPAHGDPSRARALDARPLPPPRRAVPAWLAVLALLVVVFDVARLSSLVRTQG